MSAKVSCDQSQVWKTVSEENTILFYTVFPTGLNREYQNFVQLNTGIFFYRYKIPKWFSTLRTMIFWVLCYSLDISTNCPTVCMSVSRFLADFSLDFEVCLQQKSSFLTCPKLEYGVLSQFLKILLLFGSTLWRIFMNFKIKLQLFSVEIFFEEM